MRKVAAVLLLALAAVAVGCAGSDDSTEQAPTTATTTTTVATTTTTLAPQRAAQVAYYTIVSEVNPAQEAVEKRYRGDDMKGTIAWSDVPAYCRELATVQERYVNLMSTTAWPEQFQEQVTKVIGSSSVETQLFHECADTPGTADALSDVNYRMGAASEASDADVSTLRGLLGLPIER